jgi:hypothetical protein
MGDLGETWTGREPGRWRHWRMAIRVDGMNPTATKRIGVKRGQPTR